MLDRRKSFRACSTTRKHTATRTHDTKSHTQLEEEHTSEHNSYIQNLILAPAAAQGYLPHKDAQALWMLQALCVVHCSIQQFTSQHKIYQRLSSHSRGSAAFKLPSICRKSTLLTTEADLRNRPGAQERSVQRGCTLRATLHMRRRERAAEPHPGLPPAARYQRPGK